MQATLADDLRAKKHLAELGLAVSKINHDLRNMLAAAQLMSDRLTETRDPKIRRFAPRLIATLGRAIDFCQATLAYGRAAEATPALRDVALRQLVADQAELLGLGENGAIDFVNEVPPGLVAPCDPDQMARVLSNLMRNAVQALDSIAETGERKPVLRISAGQRHGDVVLRIADNGPGVPARARDNLFQAFRGSVNPGGTGLGLAIAAELVRLHGGTIALEASEVGAVFTVSCRRSAPPRSFSQPSACWSILRDAAARLRRMRAVSVRTDAQAARSISGWLLFAGACICPTRPASASRWMIRSSVPPAFGAIWKVTTLSRKGGSSSLSRQWSSSPGTAETASTSAGSQRSRKAGMLSARQTFSGGASSWYAKTSCLAGFGVSLSLIGPCPAADP